MQTPTIGTPTISRSFSDGSLVELVYDSELAETKLALRLPDGTQTLESRIELPDGEVLVPYSPHNNLLTSGCVLLPVKIGEACSKAELLAAIKSHIERYVEMSHLFTDLAAHYVLMSWVHDAFSDLGYLRFQGDFGSGKTRALMVVGSLCYKPIFASGASTVSPLFHLLHEFGGTLVLDEADLKYSDKTADLTKILNNGTSKGMPVLRTMTNRHRELNPQAFRVFGPKLIAMREHFEDEALESRFLTESMKPGQMRSATPFHLPESQKSEALALRGKLLRWRFDYRHAIGLDPSRAIADLSARSNQSALALLSLIDDPALREAVGAHLASAETRGVNRRATLPHVAMVRVLAEKFSDGGAASIKLADATSTYNAAALANSESPLSVKAAGYLVRIKLGIETLRSGGVYVIPAYQRRKVAELAKRYGVACDE